MALEEGMAQVVNRLLLGQIEKSKRWDEGDFSKAEEVRRTEASKGWQVMKAMLLAEREGIIASTQACKDAQESLKLSGELKGFDKACNEMDRILREAERQKMILKTEKENEEEAHAA